MSSGRRQRSEALSVHGMNLSTTGNKTAKSYELIKLKIEEREHLLQLGMLSVSAVGMIILERLMRKETLDSEIVMGCKQDILAIC